MKPFHILSAFFLTALLFFTYSRATVPPVYNHGDNFWYIPVARSLMERGSFNLAPDYSEEIAAERRKGNWMVVGQDGQWHNYFPPGPSLLAVPFVYLFDLIRPFSERSLENDFITAARVSRAIAALSALLFYLLAFQLTGRIAFSLLLTGIFALATPQLSLHAGGLWSHNASQFFILLSFLLLLNFRPAAPAALLLAVLSRPTAGLFFPVLAIYLWRKRDRSALISLALAFLLTISVPFFLPVSGYFSGDTFTHNLGRFGLKPWEALSGNLVSPNRGLVALMPFTIFSLHGAFLSFTRRADAGNRAFYQMLAMALFLNWIIVSMNPNWWFGYSFGPRAFAEQSAGLVLLLIPSIGVEVVDTRPSGKRILLGIAVVFSCFVHYRGAVSIGTSQWNALPVSVDRQPERVWHWHDLQFLR